MSTSKRNDDSGSIEHAADVVSAFWSGVRRKLDEVGHMPGDMAQKIDEATEEAVQLFERRVQSNRDKLLGWIGTSHDLRIGELTKKVEHLEARLQRVETDLADFEREEVGP